MTEEQRIKQALAALDVVMQTIERLREQVATMQQKLEERNPVKDVLTHFDEHWIAAYTRGASPVEHYHFNGAKDAGHVKRLLKTMDVTTLKNRITLYFRDHSRDLIAQKHPFSFFVTRISSYTRSDAPSLHDMLDPMMPPRPPADCKHAPPCTSDQEHTRRRREEIVF